MTACADLVTSCGSIIPFQAQVCSLVLITHACLVAPLLPTAMSVLQRKGSVLPLWQERGEE